MTRDRYAQCDDACTTDCGACKGAGRPVARLSPDGTLVAIRRGPNTWHVSNGGHYRDVHVADWTPLAPVRDV